MTDRYVGKIAEYGSKEFEENQAKTTILDSGIVINPHGCEWNANLYYRTQGYKIAGSCATWGNEIWGVKIFFGDGTTGGKMFLSYDEALAYWNSLSKK
jgi:hypothetical protein